MLNIAIVEDNPEEAQRLDGFLSRYAQENSTELQTFLFSRAAAFLDKFHGQYEIVFLDIELPDMNGIDIARKIREKDDTVVLMFVTHLAQYAIKGYEVQALDYVLKPISYPSFYLKIQRSILHARRREQSVINISNKETMIRLETSQIKYIEIYKHHLLYHTEKGDFQAYGILNKVEESLPDRSFFRCGSSYIVNFRYIDSIDGMEITIGEAKIPISRARKKELLTEYHRYYGDLDSD